MGDRERGYEKTRKTGKTLPDDNCLKRQKLSTFSFYSTFPWKTKCSFGKDQRVWFERHVEPFFILGVWRCHFLFDFYNLWKSIDFPHWYSMFMQQSFEIIILPVSVQADMGHLSAVMNAMLWSVPQELCISPQQPTLVSARCSLPHSREPGITVLKVLMSKDSANNWRTCWPGRKKNYWGSHKMGSS